MPNSQIAIRVLPVSSQKGKIEFIKKALAGEEKYIFVDPVKLGDELLEDIELLKPDFILLDYMIEEFKPIDLVESITLQFPKIVVIIILPQERLPEANNAILAGARSFIVDPIDAMQLKNTLDGISEHYIKEKQQLADAEELHLKGQKGTFTIFSPRGGAGCSTVAINIALAIKKELKHEVLLVEGKFLFGDLDIMLNIKTLNSIAALIPHLSAMDEGLINDVVSEHVSGLKFLPAPTSHLLAEGIHPENLFSIIEELQGVYPNIVIDAGNYMNANTITLLKASHKILLVINPDLPSLRNTSRFLEDCHTELAIPIDKILIIINQEDQPEGLSLKDIEKALQVKVFASLPFDPKTSLHGINYGVPVVLQHKNSPLHKAFLALSKKLIKTMGN